MAKLYKRSKVTGAPWYASYTETLPNGETRKRRVSTGTPDKATAQQIIAKLQSDAAVRFYGIVDPHADAVAREAKRTIESHLIDYTNKLTTAGRSQGHIDRTCNHIREYATHAGIETVGEFAADTATAWTASLKKSGIAARTIQGRLTSIKALSKWLTSESKLMRDPFASISKPDPKSDRRLERRMLLPTEWPWLVRALNEGEIVHGMDATERRLLYRLCIQTGLRSSEVRSLGRGHFHLDGKSPFVRVVSGETKNGKNANQNIDANLANDLKRHLAKKLPKASAFNLPEAWKMAEMLRVDLAAARRLWLHETKDTDERAKREQSTFLEPTNEAGESLDFHSLRHTCGAWLAMRGVQAKVIQSVMRHSSITLTFDTYGHLIAGAEAAAIMDNADMTSVANVLAATGTDGTCVPFVSQDDALPCVDDAGVCEQGLIETGFIETLQGAFKPANHDEFAMSCETVRDDTTSRTGVTRTRNQGIMSPEFTGNNAVKTGVSVEAVSLVCPEGKKQLAELVSIWMNLSDADRLDLLIVARDMPSR